MTINDNQHSSEFTATAQNHDRETGVQLQSTTKSTDDSDMTATTAGSVENARTNVRQTSVDEKPKSRRRTV